MLPAPIKQPVELWGLAMWVKEGVRASDLADRTPPTLRVDGRKAVKRLHTCYYDRTPFYITNIYS